MAHHDSTRTIDLLKGHPNPALLPAKAISDAARAALADEAVATPALLYGADEGYLPFRQAIADWNSSFYRRTISKDNVVISGGASQNLACVLQVLTDPLCTRNVWIVSPAYMLVFRIFQDNGFASKMRAVPEIQDGLDVAWLEKELDMCHDTLQQHAQSPNKLKPDRAYSKCYRHVLYCVPTFSNPSSGIMSTERREALIRLARKHDMLVVADDVYDHLQWVNPPGQQRQPLTGAIQPRLVDIDATLDGGFTRPGADGFGNAMSNGSFSKIIAPGCRCGWTEGSEKLAFAISQVGSSRSGGAPSQLTSSYLKELLTSGWLTDHITHTLQPEYSKRHAIMRSALEEHVLPLGCHITEPDGYMGGYFIWLRLPPGVDAEELAEHCKTTQNLIIIPGTAFEVPVPGRIRHHDHIRLCFAWEHVSVLDEGIQRLAKALQKYL
ncbi:Aromatic amino acid aminotransferase [Sphaceloma murrayae]|uniref:Aromatic amino acid aminotransferase n=1 Tax=Sphaceloma murrayae TaxID=2082308 RepID=A0A2K1QTA8_9PEZI|nr:Aromatic amino acid aminotransferase [Sphaceloma murrayae]